MSEKVDILAIGAHPDDIELGCGGTLIKEIEMGKKVGLLDLTQGELGTRGNKEIRKNEAELSKNEMGAVFRDNLFLDDCFFENNRDNQIQLISKIRRYRPEIVMIETNTFAKAFAMELKNISDFPVREFTMSRKKKE